MVNPGQVLRIVALMIALYSSVISCGSISRNAPLELIILHNNDMHSRFEQTSANSNVCSKDDVTNNKCYGGFARVGYEYGILLLSNKIMSLNKNIFLD